MAARIGYFIHRLLETPFPSFSDLKGKKKYKIRFRFIIFILGSFLNPTQVGLGYFSLIIEIRQAGRAVLYLLLGFLLPYSQKYMERYAANLRLLENFMKTCKHPYTYAPYLFSISELDRVASHNVKSCIVRICLSRMDLTREWAQIHSNPEN